MKTRLGFVSNSSSSSFVINTSELSEEQVELLSTICSNPIGEWQDTWQLSIKPNEISGFTFMDNGGKDDGLEYVLTQEQFPMNRFEWHDHSSTDDDFDDFDYMDQMN